MCGISGYFAINSKPDKQELIHATDSLSHRGPDASGYFVENRVGLGHRRLSIIDTNARSNQPFYSED